MLGFRLTEAAEADIVEILSWSQSQFGVAARRRYEQLLVTALLDIALEPMRPGSLIRPELGEGTRSWHVRGSRERARYEGGTVGRPRHFIIYRPAATLIVVGRILHDAMELERHMGDPRLWD